MRRAALNTPSLPWIMYRSASCSRGESLVSSRRATNG